MRAGTRRNFITIQTPVQEKQPNGSFKTVWQDYRQLWASIETLKAYEKTAAAATWPGSDQKISFRYIDGILPTMRVVYNNVIYAILGINNVEMRNRELILTTKAGVAAQ